MEYGEKSFEHFFRSHYLLMFRMAFSLLENEEDAKDAVSQVFLSIWQNKPKIADNLVDGYLRSAIHNECLHIQRKRLLRWEMEEETKCPLSCEEDAPLDQTVNNAIEEHLSEENKKILALHYREGLTYAETAEEMGMSHSSVHKRVHKMLKELRTIFNKKK